MHRETLKDGDTQGGARPSLARAACVLSLGLAPAFLLAACGPDLDNDPSSVPRRGDVWALSPDPTVEVGGASAEGPYALFRVHGALTLADGRIVVWQGEGEILLFSEAGVFERYLGRNGQGPGEFRWVIEASLMKESGCLSVLDLSNSRITTLDLEGEATEIVGVEPSSLVMARSWRGQSDGSFLGELRESTRKAMAREEMRVGLFRDSIHVVHLSERGVEVIHTLRDGVRFRTGSGNFFMSSYPPLGRRLLTALGPGLYTQGFNDQGVFRILSLGGDTVGTVRAVTPQRPIPSAVRAQEEEEFLDRTHFDPLLGEGREGLFRRILEGVPEPEYLPLVDQARFDVEGNLWLRRFDPGSQGPSVWEVHSAQGDFLAEASIPREMDLLEIGPGHVLGLLTDSLDIERIARFELVRNDRKSG